MSPKSIHTFGLQHLVESGSDDVIVVQLIQRQNKRWKLGVEEVLQVENLHCSSVSVRQDLASRVNPLSQLNNLLLFKNYYQFTGNMCCLTTIVAKIYPITPSELSFRDLMKMMTKALLLIFILKVSMYFICF